MDNDKKDSSRIPGKEMKFLRSMLGKTRRDRLQNTKLWEILKLDKIQGERDSKIRWYGQVKRMNTGRIPRQTMEYQLGGKRPRGQPRYKWEKQVKNNVGKIGIKWMEMMEEETWSNQDRWRLLSKTQHPDTRFDEEVWHITMLPQALQILFTYIELVQGYFTTRFVT